MAIGTGGGLKFEINPARLNYILELYGLPQDEFVAYMNQGSKKEVLTIDKLSKILNKEEKVNPAFLRKMDTIFNKGITWYISKRDLPKRESGSIFFRKDSFNTQLNLESRKLIDSYEELKFELQILCKQVNYPAKRILEQQKLSDNSQELAREFRKKVDIIEKEFIAKKYLIRANTDRDYLQNLIRVLESFNIFVFEFVDRKKNPDKQIAFNGFFMLPNIIVIKRQQRYLRREIFTLLHEVAHYLLNAEEVDENVDSNDFDNQTEVEKWCSTFAYSFLLGEFEKEFSSLKIASSKNNFCKEEVQTIHDKTYLSTYAIYTRLRIENRITKQDYDKIKNEILANITRAQQEQKMRLKEELRLAKEQGREIFIRGPQEIKSHLFEEIVRLNYFQGNISENRLREHLKIKPKQTLEEVIY
jgi:Zn-dependent peptidase ImmA (M78 family)